MQEFLASVLTDMLLSWKMSQMENFLARFWMPISEHSHLNSRQLLFSFALSDSHALKLKSYQQQLPEFVWPADILSQINKPDLMYSSW